MLLLLHQHAGRFADAERVARAFCRSYPDSDVGWNGLGCALLERNDVSGALDAFIHSTECAPKDTSNYVVAYANVAEALYRLGAVEDAHQTLDEALSYGDRSNIGLCVKLAIQAAYVDRLGQSVEFYAHAVAMNRGEDVTGDAVQYILSLPEAYLDGITVPKPVVSAIDRILLSQGKGQAIEYIAGEDDPHFTAFEATSLLRARANLTVLAAK